MDERDEHGNQTDYALAMDALQDLGCDCGTDEPGTCLVCLCRRALLTERRERDSGRNLVRRLYLSNTFELRLDDRLRDDLRAFLGEE